MVRIRWDIAIVLVLSSLIGLAARQITMKLIDANDESTKNVEEVITDGTVGARAEAKTPRLESVEQILNHDGLFTIEAKDGYNGIRGEYTSEHMEEYSRFHYVKLDNGEYVIVRLFDDSVVYESTPNEHGIAKGSYIMPIGTVVNEPAPAPVLDYMMAHYDITNPGFYIDMCGSHQAASIAAPVNKNEWGDNAMLIGMFSSFFIIRFIGVKIGLLPPMFEKKKK